MGKYIGMFIIITFSILLLYIGYNAIFNTEKLLKIFTRIAKYEENSNMYSYIMKNSNIISTKIAGVFIIFFGLLLLYVAIFYKTAGPNLN
jgi:hypothetical protein